MGFYFYLVRKNVIYDVYFEGKKKSTSRIFQKNIIKPRNIFGT